MTDAKANDATVRLKADFISLFIGGNCALLQIFKNNPEVFFLQGVIIAQSGKKCGHLVQVQAESVLSLG